MVQIYHPLELEVVSNQTHVDILQIFRTPSSTSQSPVPLTTSTTTRHPEKEHHHLPETIDLDTTDNEEQNYDIDKLGILTQYIGPKTNRQATNTTIESEPDQLIDMELKTFKERYANQTHSLDRAINHADSLKAAQAKQKTPAKLHIQIKPQVINKEEPGFTIKWNSIIKSAENQMVQCIIDHLEKTQTETREKIRSLFNETLLNLKRLDPTGVIDKLKSSLL